MKRILYQRKVIDICSLCKKEIEIYCYDMMNL